MEDERPEGRVATSQIRDGLPGQTARHTAYHYNVQEAYAADLIAYRTMCGIIPRRMLRGVCKFVSLDF